MKIRMARVGFTFIAAGALAHGQLLYNQARDEAAQNALELGQGIASGAVFDKQIENLDRMNKYSMDRVFGGAELQMRANLLRLSTWTRIQQFVSQMEQRISRNQAQISGAAYNKRKADAEAAIKTAEDEMNALKQRATAGAREQDFLNQVGAQLERIGKLDEARQALERLPKVGDSLTLPAAYGEAADEIAGLATSLAQLFNNFKITLPASPDVISMQTHLDLLEAEATHQATLASIATRRDMESGDTLTLIEETTNELTGIRNQQVSDDVAASLTKAVADAKAATGEADIKRTRDIVRVMTHALYNASALAARDETPLRLATLRAAAEERAYSIHESAIAARGYELTLVNGLQRLSLYYKGGLKPQTAAQLLNALGTLGLIPTILTR